jgi:hypothetical protein
VADRAVGSSTGSLGRASSVGVATTLAYVTTSFEIRSRAPLARVCAAHSKRVRHERVTLGIGRGQCGRARDPDCLHTEILAESRRVHGTFTRAAVQEGLAAMLEEHFGGSS